MIEILQNLSILKDKVNITGKKHQKYPIGAALQAVWHRLPHGRVLYGPKEVLVGFWCSHLWTQKIEVDNCVPCQASVVGRRTSGVDGYSDSGQMTVLHQPGLPGYQPKVSFICWRGKE